MRMTYLVHILAGSIGLLSGYVALFAGKGETLHRKSGRIFVYAMITMSLVGGLIALVRSKAPEGNVPVAFLTTYLVITALTTVRPRTGGSRRLDISLLLMASAITLTFFTFGGLAIASPTGRLHGFPAPPFFIFGSIALLASIGDLRLIRSGSVHATRGGPRLARHLWRMCTALLIAALSASVQFGKLIPKPFRVPGLLTVPLIAIVVAMVYWLWRVRFRRTFQAILAARGPGNLTTISQAGRTP
jgi:uncharacterized membrane protein